MIAARAANSGSLKSLSKSHSPQIWITLVSLPCPQKSRSMHPPILISFTSLKAAQVASRVSVMYFSQSPKLLLTLCMRKNSKRRSHGERCVNYLWCICDVFKTKWLMAFSRGRFAGSCPGYDNHAFRHIVCACPRELTSSPVPALISRPLAGCKDTIITWPCPYPTHGGLYIAIRIRKWSPVYPWCIITSHVTIVTSQLCVTLLPNPRISLVVYSTLPKCV